MQLWNKILTAVLITAILISISLIIYINAAPNPRDRFTEFYILNTGGKAADFPGQVRSDEPVELILGIVNHEMGTVPYKVKIMAQTTLVKSVDIGVLPNGGKWEQKVSFIPVTRGTGQRYEFFLYSGESDKPHIDSPLVLILDVT